MSSMLVTPASTIFYASPIRGCDDHALTVADVDEVKAHRSGKPVPPRGVRGRGGIRQLPILLAKIGKNEPCDLVGSLGLVKSMHGRVLSAIEYCAENAEHPCESKLAWRLFSQAIAR